MNIEDVLPDKWGEVAEMRANMLHDRLLQHMWDSDYAMRECLNCSLFRVIRRGGVVFTWCTFNDKCIKEYPDTYDKKEFK